MFSHDPKWVKNSQLTAGAGESKVVKQVENVL